MAWVLLVIAGLLETAWAVGLKYTEGLTRVWPTVFVAATMIGSMWLLAIATRTLPIGTSYAVWVGIGVVGTTIVGFVALDESFSLVRSLCLLGLVASIVGLKLTASE